MKANFVSPTLSLSCHSHVKTQKGQKQGVLVVMEGLKCKQGLLNLSVLHVRHEEWCTDDKISFKISLDFFKILDAISNPPQDIVDCFSHHYCNRSKRKQYYRSSGILPKVANLPLCRKNPPCWQTVECIHGSSHQIEVSWWLSSKFQPDVCNRWLFKISTDGSDLEPLFVKQPTVTQPHLQVNHRTINISQF